jgi:hypothetical protein
MTAYLLTMPSGFPGSLTRQEHATVEGQPINTTSPPQTYGQVVVMDVATGTIRQPTTTDTTGFWGISVRPYPTQGFGPAGSAALSSPVGAVTPPTAGAVDVMRRGYILCQLGGATAAVKGAPVNVWTGATGAGQVTGRLLCGAAGRCVHVGAGPRAVVPGPRGSGVQHLRRYVRIYAGLERIAAPPHTLKGYAHARRHDWHPARIRRFADV